MSEKYVGPRKENNQENSSDPRLTVDVQKTLEIPDEVLMQRLKSASLEIRSRILETCRNVTSDQIDDARKQMQESIIGGRYIIENTETNDGFEPEYLPTYLEDELYRETFDQEVGRSTISELYRLIYHMEEAKKVQHSYQEVRSSFVNECSIYTKTDVGEIVDGIERDVILQELGLNDSNQPWGALFVIELEFDEGRELDESSLAQLRRKIVDFGMASARTRILDLKNMMAKQIGSDSASSSPFGVVFDAYQLQFHDNHRLDTYEAFVDFEKEIINKFSGKNKS